MRLVLCIILATLASGQIGCAKVAGFVVAAILNDDCDDEPSVRPSDRQIRRDEGRLARGEPMRYHQDERELRRHKSDVAAMKHMRSMQK
jgi:hypothetical protein